MSIIYLNGEYLPLEKACVSVEDRGFLFGDGVYEVVRIYHGRPFELGAHLQRLQRSAQEAYLPLARAAADLPVIIQRLLTENGLQDTNIYIECTRGAAHPRTHAFPVETHPTLLLMLLPLRVKPKEAFTQGLSTVTVPDVRWQRCDIKSITLLPNVMAKQQAQQQGAFEAIFVRDGIVTEGSSMNVFAVFEGILTTHPADQHILAGITRQVVLALAAELGLAVREGALTLDQLYAADEAFLTSTSSEILPITRVDSRAIAAGYPGPVTMRLFEAFQREVENGG